MRFHYRGPEPGNPAIEADSKLFDSPEQMVLLMADYGVTVDAMRVARGSGLI